MLFVASWGHFSHSLLDLEQKRVILRVSRGAATGLKKEGRWELHKRDINTGTIRPRSEFVRGLIAAEVGPDSKPSHLLQLGLVSVWNQKQTQG